MDKVNIHANICRELTELYERKNHDYGDSFAKSYDEYGLVMPCMRLEDKLNRLKTLRNAEAEVDESIEDTLMDLANYAIMTLVERKRTKAPYDGIAYYTERVTKGCYNCRHKGKGEYESPCNKCSHCVESDIKDRWEAEE